MMECASGGLILSEEMFAKSPPRKIAVFAGGGGGVGRSTLVAELGRVLCRMGERVLIVDAHGYAPTMWLRLGLPAPWPDDISPSPADTPEDWDLRAWAPLPDRPGLVTLGDVVLHGSGSWGRDLIEVSEHWPVTWVFVDIGPDPEQGSLELFSEADLPVLCSSMEGPSLIAAKAWLGFCAMWSTQSDELALLLMNLLNKSALISSLIVPDELEDELADWRQVVSQIQPNLVLMKARDSAEREAGYALSLALGELTGIRPSVLGVVDDDDRRWFEVRQGQLGALLKSEAGVGAQVEEIAKAVRALSSEGRGVEEPLPPWEVSTPFQLLGLSDEASSREVKDRYRKIWETLHRTNPLSTQLLKEDQCKDLNQRVTEAYQVLQPWLGQVTGGMRTTGLTVAVQRSHPGQRIRQARVARGWNIGELSVRTKVSARNLEAIESLRPDVVSEPNHLRAYLEEIQTALELDPSIIQMWLSAAQN